MSIQRVQIKHETFFGLCRLQETKQLVQTAVERHCFKIQWISFVELCAA